MSEFGERTFLLDALPPFVKAADARRFVFDLVDELKAAGREVNLARLGEHTVAKTVCRHAVKANDPLGGAELENLVEDLRRCAMPYTCPHGRPTLIEMNYRELEKKVWPDAVITLRNPCQIRTRNDQDRNLTPARRRPKTFPANTGGFACNAVMS